MSLENMAASGDEYDDPPAITLGDLRDGESVTLTPAGGVETFTSQYADDDEEDDALRWETMYVDSDYTFTPDAGADPIAEGDECVLVSWSTNLAAAILAAADEPDARDLVGTPVEIQKFGSGYDVTYRVVEADE